MTEDDKNLDGQETDKTSAANGVDTRRRMVMTAAALLVPAIATLHATPAWAETDYTMTAYRYGTNAGRCKNPNFNPNANPNSTAGQEFIDCPTYQGSTAEVVGGELTDEAPGPIGF